MKTSLQEIANMQKEMLKRFGCLIVILIFFSVKCNRSDLGEQCSVEMKMKGARAPPQGEQLV